MRRKYVSRVEWRGKCRDALKKALARLPSDATEDERKQAISDAYPGSARRGLLYNVWLEEVKKCA